MNVTDHNEAAIQPRLIERRRGGWLAVAPEGSAVRLGVTAETEAEAREKFSLSLGRVELTLAAEKAKGEVERSPI